MSLLRPAYSRNDPEACQNKGRVPELSRRGSFLKFLLNLFYGTCLFGFISYIVTLLFELNLNVWVHLTAKNSVDVITKQKQCQGLMCKTKYLIFSNKNSKDSNCIHLHVNLNHISGFLIYTLGPHMGICVWTAGT